MRVFDAQRQLQQQAKADAADAVDSRKLGVVDSQKYFQNHHVQRRADAAHQQHTACGAAKGAPILRLAQQQKHQQHDAKPRRRA